jgi:hypothetical protein
MTDIVESTTDNEAISETITGDQATEIVTNDIPSETENQVKTNESVKEVRKVETVSERIEREINAVKAIKDFTIELNEMFGKKKQGSSLALYNRLLKSIQLSDENSVAKTLLGFNEFFNLNSKFILEENSLSNIPRGTIIKYGSSTSICIDIQHFIYESDDETKEVIRQHLLTIYCLLNPESKQMAAAELNKSLQSLNIDQESNEGKFLTNFFQSANQSLSETAQPDNPMSAITSLLTSPIFSNLLTNLQSGVSKGNIDPQKMIGSLTGALGGMMSEMGKVEAKGKGKR